MGDLLDRHALGKEEDGLELGRRQLGSVLDVHALRTTRSDRAAGRTIRIRVSMPGTSVTISWLVSARRLSPRPFTSMYPQLLDRLGPLLGLPRSTVAAILHREGVPRLADLDRPTGLPVRRYEA